MQTLAAKVARLRERKGWSQERLASAAAVGASTIAHIERGSRAACQPATLKALAGALGVPVDYFTTDDPAHYLRIRLATLAPNEAALLASLSLQERIRWVLQDLEEKWGPSVSAGAAADRADLTPAALEQLLTEPRPDGEALRRLAAGLGLPASFLLPSPALAERYAEAIALAAAGDLSPETLRELVLRAIGQPEPPR
ncbi:MAG: helix-turn-helix domain-containing protein [Bacillota bacterium]